MFRHRGGRAVVAGETWADAERLARRRAARDGARFVHPFSDPTVIAGCATVALELFELVPATTVVVVPAGPSCGLGPIGGSPWPPRSCARCAGRGGRARGLAAAAAGAEAAESSQRRAEPPPRLGPTRAEPINVTLARRYVDEVVAVTEPEIDAALELLWLELGSGVSRQGSMALAAVLSGRVRVRSDEPAAILIAEAGYEGLFRSSV